MNINTSAMFYWDFVSDCYIRFNLWGGTLAAGSLVSSSSSLGYRYGFTAVVLKLVGPLGSYILYISLLIPSNLNGLVHLLLYPVLPLRYISTSELRGRLWIIVTDGLFY